MIEYFIIFIVLHTNFSILICGSFEKYGPESWASFWVIFILIFVQL